MADFASRRAEMESSTVRFYISPGHRTSSDTENTWNLMPPHLSRRPILRLYRTLPEIPRSCGNLEEIERSNFHNTAYTMLDGFTELGSIEWVIHLINNRFAWDYFASLASNNQCIGCRRKSKGSPGVPYLHSRRGGGIGSPNIRP